MTTRDWISLLYKCQGPPMTIQYIQQILSSPDIFSFSDLLLIPNVLNIQSTTTYQLLSLFSFGTLKEYHEQCQSLPPLTPELRYKLQLLTLVSMACHQQTLDLSQLEIELGLNTSQVHELIMDAMNHKLIKGKINCQSKSLIVYESVGRDVQDSEIQALYTEFKKIQSNCIELDSFIHDLSSQVSVKSEEYKNANNARQAQLNSKAQEHNTKSLSKSSNNYS